MTDSMKEVQVKEEDEEELWGRTWIRHCLETRNGLAVNSGGSYNFTDGMVIYKSVLRENWVVSINAILAQ